MASSMKINQIQIEAFKLLQSVEQYDTHTTLEELESDRKQLIKIIFNSKIQKVGIGFIKQLEKSLNNIDKKIKKKK
jgi:hypothetical protein